MKKIHGAVQALKSDIYGILAAILDFEEAEKRKKKITGQVH